MTNVEQEGYVAMLGVGTWGRGMRCVEVLRREQGKG